ncbi:homoserine O-acetyltransferase MetX [Halodesulfurarchaeum formicicum]|uniref:Homoserine O-acetyltransferase n=1 Tax=Halodesulfurarchaeum formicicum TaxID=1873524 RepID=A0A1J1AEJ6_9EURY|nr:homoserine O-acetyltransferase [Halodesulfurarchaeum formicicum]APE96562.1 homoserine O-acetyltransferase [Halodesulfurarchaeum formicicum]
MTGEHPATDGGPIAEPTNQVSVGAFEFERGGQVDLDVAYETFGDPADPPVLVAHALTGSQYVTGSGPEGIDGQAAGWWSEVVGPGRPVDTENFFVVVANVPGSCYGTTGPASIGPDGEPYGPDFPAVTITDWVRAQARLLDELGIETLYAVVGGSVGGMNAIEWARTYPERVERIAAIATAPRVDTQNLALDSIARRAITQDPDFQGGAYYGSPGPTDGLGLARRIGHVQYLSKDSMENRFGRRAADRVIAGVADPTAEAFPYRDVASYLDYNASTFVDRFDANSYLYLLRAMDEYDLAAGQGSATDAVADFDGSILVLSYTGDWQFTVEQGREIAAAFEAAGAEVTFEKIVDDYGHDAFLARPETVTGPLDSFLDGQTVNDPSELRVSP